MNESYEQKLEERLARELHALPGYQAPGSLLPRVLAAVAARQRAPWWMKSWSDWPAGIRSLFLIVSLSLAGGLVIAGMQLPAGAGLAAGTTEVISGWFAWLQPYQQLIARLAEALWITIKAVPAPVLWLGAAVVGLAYATCVGLGTLGYRLALNRI